MRSKFSQQHRAVAKLGALASTVPLQLRSSPSAAAPLSIYAFSIAAILSAFSPLYGASAALLIAACVAIPHLAHRPEYLIYVAAGLTITNLSDVLIQRFEFPSIAKLAVAATAIAFVISLRAGIARPIFPRTAVQLLALYAASAGLAIFSAYDQFVALAGFGALLQELVIVLLFLLIVQDPDVLRGTGRAIAGALSLVAGLGILRMMAPEQVPDFFGLANIEIATIVGDYDSGRLTGPFADPNSYARILLIAFPFACLELVESKSVAGRAVALISTALIVGATVLTSSRGALVALLAVSGIMLWQYRDKAWYLAAFVVPCLLLAVAAGPEQHLQRVYTIFGSLPGEVKGTSEKDESIQNRKEEMGAAVLMFRDHPLLGVGYRNYPEMFQKYTLENHYSLRHEDRLPHSRYLEIASEQGLVGLVVFSAICGWGLLTSFRSRQALGTQGRVAGAIGLALLGYLIASIFLHEDYSRIFWLLMSMVLALPQCVESWRNGRYGLSTEGSTPKSFARAGLPSTGGC